MSEVIVPEELFDSHKEVWKRTKHGNFVGEDMGEEEFFLLLIKDELTLENYFRKECLEKGNTLIYNGKNISGEIFYRILNDIVVATKSGKCDTKNLVAKAKSLILDSTEFFKEQAKTDGFCLSLLFSNAKELFIMRDVGESHKLFDEAYKLYQTLDLSTLYWEDTPSSIFFFEGFISGVFLSIYGEAEEDDLILFNAFNKWVNPVLTAKGKLKLLCTSYHMHYFPINWSYFNKMFQRFWDNKEISEIDKLSIFYNLEILKSVASPVKHPTDNRVMMLQGDETTLDVIRRWGIHNFPATVATTKVSVLTKFVKTLKKYKLFTLFITDLQEEFKATEDIFKLLGGLIPDFVLNLKALNEPEITDIFEDKLLNAGFPLVAHELTGREYKDMNESLSARVLTTSSSNVKIYFNQKEGQVEVDVGAVAQIIEIKEHIGEVICPNPDYVVIGKYEKAFITPR